MKIVSLAPSNTEIIYELNAEKDLVGTTTLCDRPKEAIGKPSVGGWTNPRIDRLEELEPDLVLASDDLQDGAVERVRDAGYEVLQVKPHSLEEVYESIREIGKKIERLKEAEELIKKIKSDLEEVELENSPRIYCEEWMNPPMVSGNWIPQLIEKIGGQYFIEEGRSREVDVEEVKEFDPEYIFLNVCGAGENLDPEEIKKREEWKDISAVKNDNIYVIDDSLLNRPGPRLVDGVKQIKEVIEKS